MPTDDLTADLSKLEKDYQILTELHGDGDSRTYLARHLQLNRDVTITLLRAPKGDDANALAQFAADSRLLTTNRHPNLVPVIEGLWLDDKTFAIVRARVRGSSLSQAIESEGPLPVSRVATTVHQLVDAVSWARDAGVVHRHISPRSLVFQQGSGRALLSFEPTPLALDRLPDNADDAHLIGALAADMLAGEQAAPVDESPSAIVVPRQIIPSVAEALEAVRQSNHANASAALQSLIAELDLAASHAGTAVTAPVATATQTEPVATAAANEPAAIAERVVTPKVERSADIRPVPSTAPIRAVLPGESHDKPVVVVKPGFGFNARLATALAVAVVIAVLGLFVVQRRDTTVNRVAVGSTDTMGTAAGEVASRKTPDTSAMVYAPAPGHIEPRPPVTAAAPTTAPGTIASPTTTVAKDSMAGRAMTSPPLPRQEAAKPAPITVQRDSNYVERKRPVDSATAAERQFQRDSALGVSDVCRSPASSDQHQCLMNSIDRNDRELNSVYAKLIAALRRQAGTGAGDADPDAVDELRATQRRWVDERDVACRDVGQAPLYAKSRAACFAQLSSDRAHVLQKMLDAVPPGA